ncbi:TlyA family RNA methyltransferase [Limnohabitans sp. 2KL-51]|uniref:TlyA family RNA methyltransferase n=1 Tax=Limnohabitans sp. 2KL-51 TaxID=1977911 RepID=UPI000D3B84C3|nr:TlyA family RNA methyltransferase [Limnohabitans sp. 2KL-51]PUE45317.1 hemolysin [Limnohabitans sp. 2KL-51]
MRIDQLLVERGLAASRSQAQRLIAGGVKWQQPDGSWRAIVKNRDEVPDGAALELLDDAESRYVSRGGLKLEGALKATGVLVEGLRCLDVGQSTGGFTDCLLQHGAAEVVGIDVGHAQVHSRISQDERVVCIEGVNARELVPGDERIPEALEGFDLVVGDVSFISLTLVLPGVVHLLKPTGQLLMLVKPQFELQPGQVGKGGIVKDDTHFPFIENRVRTALSELGMQVTAWLDSPIEGGDGNHEFFVQACWPDPAAVAPAREKAREAHEADLAALAYAKANDY